MSRAWSKSGTLLMLTLATPVIAGPADHSECQRAGSDQGVVQGRLGLLEGIGPAAFILKLQGPFCLQGDEATDTVAQSQTVQLYSVSAEGFQELYRLVGEQVYVRGKLSGLKSFQQKAPVLMEVIEIATR